MTHITCRLTAKKWDQLRNRMLGNRVPFRLPFTLLLLLLCYRYYYYYCIWHVSACSDGELRLLHPFNGLFSGTTWISQYQKGKTSLDLNEARDNVVWDAVVSAGPYANNLHLAPVR